MHFISFLSFQCILFILLYLILCRGGNHLENFKVRGHGNKFHALATKNFLLRSHEHLSPCPRTLKHSLAIANHLFVAETNKKIQISLNFLFCFSNKIVGKKCFATKKFNMGTHISDCNKLCFLLLAHEICFRVPLPLNWNATKLKSSKKIHAAQFHILTSFRDLAEVHGI